MFLLSNKYTCISNNIIVKQKYNNVIKSSNKNNQVLMKVMDKINTIQLEIE